jgi:hypothetical protein
MRTRCRPPRVAQLAGAGRVNAVLDQMVVMREELRQIWLNTSHSREQLAALTCRPGAGAPKASGIAALREFSMQLRCGARADGLRRVQPVKVSCAVRWSGQATKNPLRKRVFLEVRR